MVVPPPFAGFRHVASARFGALAEDADPALTGGVHEPEPAGAGDPRRALRALLEEHSVPFRDIAVYTAHPSVAVPVPGTLATLQPAPPSRWGWYAQVDARAGEVHLYRRQEWD